MGSERRFWLSRLRWRMRGEWQWPTFAAVLVADAAIMHLLPPFPGGVSLAPALILSSFANLFLIGAVAPFIARRLARREARDPAAAAPLDVIANRTGTGLLLAGTLAVTAAGLASRPLIVSETEATERNARVVRDWVLAHGSPEYRRNLDTANTIRLADGFFRTCVAADDRRRAFCLFVNTNREPPEVRPDPRSTPNAEFVGRVGER